MRVDSNTRGHTTWFYFKVTNFTDKQKVKFNIINFQKNGLMYKDGMKPYCYRSSNKKWEQEAINIEYKPKNFRYHF
jgi:cytosolic carboxypeptidase protein 2/3